ncbi:MAG: hypothetical protein VYE44_07490, partial [Verrucomicrobiota bacterium]|nr:hypothetical protein [Verrucomicrobiota bacterium]
GVTTWGSALANIIKAEHYSLEAKDSKPPEPAVLDISQSGGMVTISWDGDGQLEKAATVNGPWAPVNGGSPAKISPVAGQGFYRVTR